MVINRTKGMIMDGSLLKDDVFDTLKAMLGAVHTYTEARAAVRAWAAEHWFLPATTTPVATGLRVAYYDVERGCRQFVVEIDDARLQAFAAEYEAGQGGW